MKNIETKMIPIGTTQVKTYICPNCGRQKDHPYHDNCEVCGIAMCWDCRDLFGSWWICKKHKHSIEEAVNKEIKRIRQEE